MRHYFLILIQRAKIQTEWNGMEWNGMEWNGMEWNGMEWNGMEWNSFPVIPYRILSK